MSHVTPHVSRTTLNLDLDRATFALLASIACRTPVYPLGGQIPVPFEQKSSLRGDDARSSALDKVGCHVFREQEQQVSVF
ncbi:hypothetical protein B0H12DRAFT_1148779 [Mycena haematopus]|nr:hypothetical protein B0H12DRAFT_1148779 [Mycena haematopus]